MRRTGVRETERAGALFAESVGSAAATLGGLTWEGERGTGGAEKKVIIKISVELATPLSRGEGAGGMLGLGDGGKGKGG